MYFPNRNSAPKLPELAHAEVWDGLAERSHLFKSVQPTSVRAARPQPADHPDYMTATPTEQHESIAEQQQVVQPSGPLPIWTRLRKKVAPEGSLRHSLLEMARYMAEWCFRDAPRRIRMVEVLGKSPVLLVCDNPNLARISQVSGFTSVRGWAISKSKLDRICVLIDEIFVGEAFYGFLRHDEMPSRNSVGSNSGFAFRLATWQLRPGPHSIKIVASALDGNTASVEGRIEVVPGESDEDDLGNRFLDAQQSE